MKILNLGCGTKASPNPDVINIDWSVHLILKKNRIGRSIVPLFAKGQRLKRFSSLPDNIMFRNLTKRFPFSSDTIDVVYHSHLLEHFDPLVAEKFLLEVRRVLKPSGIQRIVVPDLEQACKAYLAHLALCEVDPEEAGNHDRFVATIIEQCVRRQAYGASQQKPFNRYIENMLLGDARRRGETHQWMYDKINLCALLTRLGYKNPLLQRYDTSSIPNWSQYGLDIGEDGREYKPESLYMEVQK
jgi:SAM-dependent methyltransferase